MPTLKRKEPTQKSKNVCEVDTSRLLSVSDDGQKITHG